MLVAENLSFTLQEKEDHFESVQLKSSRSQNIWRFIAAFKETNLISIFTGPHFKHILAYILVVISLTKVELEREVEDQNKRVGCLITWSSTLPKRKADTWIPYWKWNLTQEERDILPTTWDIHLGIAQACNVIYRYLSLFLTPSTHIIRNYSSERLEIFYKGSALFLL